MAQRRLFPLTSCMMSGPCSNEPQGLTLRCFVFLAVWDIGSLRQSSHTFSSPSSIQRILLKQIPLVVKWLCALSVPSDTLRLFPVIFLSYFFSLRTSKRTNPEGKMGFLKDHTSLFTSFISLQDKTAITMCCSYWHLFTWKRSDPQHQKAEVRLHSTSSIMVELNRCWEQEGDKFGILESMTDRMTQQLSKSEDKTSQLLPDGRLR